MDHMEVATTTTWEQQQQHVGHDVQDEHPWRGKTAFGFATILNRSADHDVSASPVGLSNSSLPSLQAYSMAGSSSSSMDKKGPSLHGVGTRPTPIAPLGSDDLSTGGRSSLKLKIKKKHVDISPSFHQTPIAPSTPSVANGHARKLPLAPAPLVHPLNDEDDEDDDESGDDVEEGAVSSATGAALRGGRWTSEEHERFLSGFRQHGHKWKRVQMVVRSRTVTQVRTHAQKYLLKLQKISGEPRSSSDITYMQSFGHPTSPTQSLLSNAGGNHHHDGEDLQHQQPPHTLPSLPHQLLSSLSRSRLPPDDVPAVATCPDQLPYPVSPDVVLPSDELAHLSPMSKQQLKRQLSTGRTGKNPPMKRVKKATSKAADAAVIKEAAHALCLLNAQQIDELEVTDMEQHDDDASTDDDDDDESYCDAIGPDLPEQAATSPPPSTTTTPRPIPVKKNAPTSSKKRYLCRKCRVPKKGHVCDMGGSQDGDDEAAAVASKLEPLPTTDGLVTWRSGDEFEVVHATQSKPPTAAWVVHNNDQQLHIAYSDATTTTTTTSTSGSPPTKPAIERDQQKLHPMDGLPPKEEGTASSLSDDE
ncbi:hypothetical protein DYB37_003936 [Aphanomyces astaci]|uniref:Uncharacterized protein n=1 Tax=Aphanomyces astaci TaxID=112090 RepID=A0A3R7C470_APHAT|nr:hypothetical protein DYB37_003936 [Aphanomyces astaci]